MKPETTSILIKILTATLFITLFQTGCSDNNKKKQNAAPPEKEYLLPSVTDSSKNIMFSWFKDSTPATATDISKIPDDAKKNVRVQDLSLPPEKRNPDWIFLADLTKKNADGKYSVHAVKRSDYEKKRHPETAKATSGPSTDKTKVTLSSPVILYATNHCPYCKKARKWLLQQQIPFKEVNIETDAAATSRLQKLGQEQGVSTAGVPMLEVNGRLIPGFDPAAVIRALKAGPPTHPPAIKTPAASPLPPVQKSPVKPANPATSQII
jgi:glutaredoxin